MPKLTKRIVDGLTADPAGKDVFVWDSGDGALKGFGVRIKGSGAASYIVQYRNKEGRTRRMVVGRVNVLTPDEARQQAQDKLREVTKGADPSAERHADRKAMNVAQLCDWYLREAKGWVKASTLEADRSRIESHVKPLLGSRVVAGLTLNDLEKFQADIAAGKTAKPRPKKGRSGKISGGRGVAARTVGMLGTILEFAKRKKIITENVARGVRKYPDEKCRRFLSLDEIKSLGAAMKEGEAALENKTGIAALRALLLTGCRRNEILALPREWLDARAQCIRFEDSKSGAQLRPIGKSAAEFLASRPVKKDCKWIFPADHGEGHFIGLPRVLERLCEKAGIKGITIHTLRHSYAAVAAEMGFSELTIAGLLGHRVSGVTARYAHVPDSALISAADKVAERISLALEGKKMGEVVSIFALKIAQ
ncbi:MAG: DUF4102 domain-containing protein [Alphaproteobacteria bacterium PRO2]|nr:DUF4102 domain-containing protein [Alphaproteobacteria bacterium PRO2]